MLKSARLRAEQQFAALRGPAPAIDAERERARQERAEQAARLRALRLAKESVDKTAAEKAASEKAARGAKKANRLPQAHRRPS